MGEDLVTNKLRLILSTIFLVLANLSRIANVGKGLEGSRPSILVTGLFALLCHDCLPPTHDRDNLLFFLCHGFQLRCYLRMPPSRLFQLALIFL